MQRSLAGLVVAAGLAFAAPAQAAITYERLTNEDGFKILLLKGEFEADEDVGKLEDEVAAFEPDTLMFDSPGGIITTALEYGRKIRELEMDTLQVRAHLCASACAFAFAGGVNRRAEAGSIGVHQTWLPDDVATSDAVAGVQAITADVMAYLVEMGVDTALLQMSMTTASEDMRYLTVQEMSDIDMITPEPEAEDGSTQTDDQDTDEEAQTDTGAEEAVEEQMPRRRKVKPAG